MKARAYVMKYFEHADTYATYKFVKVFQILYDQGLQVNMCTNKIDTGLP